MSASREVGSECSEWDGGHLLARVCTHEVRVDIALPSSRPRCAVLAVVRTAISVRCVDSDCALKVLILIALALLVDLVRMGGGTADSRPPWHLKARGGVDIRRQGRYEERQGA